MVVLCCIYECFVLNTRCAAQIIVTHQWFDSRLESEASKGNL